MMQQEADLDSESRYIMMIKRVEQFGCTTKQQSRQWLC